MWCFRFIFLLPPFIRFGLFFRFSSGGLWENGEGEKWLGCVEWMNGVKGGGSLAGCISSLIDVVPYTLFPFLWMNDGILNRGVGICSLVLVIYIHVCPGVLGCFLVSKNPELISMLGSYRFPSLPHLKILCPPELWPPPSFLPSASRRITSYHIQSRATAISPAKHNDREPIFSHLSLKKRDIAPHECKKKNRKKNIERKLVLNICFYPTSSTIPPTSLIFFSARAETYLALTITGTSGRRPLPRTLEYPSASKSMTGAVSDFSERYLRRDSAGTRDHSFFYKKKSKRIRLAGLRRGE